ncbi:MAG: hypothetical protein V4475_01820 [Pseudomonadota bacterium]
MIAKDARQPEAARGATIFAIVGLLWGGFAIIVSIASFSDHMVLSGVFWLAASAVLAPVPAITAWFARSGFGRGRRYALAVVAFIIGLALIGGTATNEAKPVALAGRVATTPRAPTPAVAPARDARKTDFLAMYRQVLSTAGPCDSANKRAGNRLQDVSRGNASLVDAYTEAKDGQAECETAWLAMGKIEAPASLTGDVARDTDKALESCSTAYFSRKQSLEVMMEVVDGDMRPSRVAEYKEKAQGAQTLTMLCVLGLSQAGMALGIDAKELTSS